MSATQDRATDAMATSATPSFCHTRSNARLAYEEYGAPDAPPVVFIRGTGASGTRWMPQVDDYRHGYRCVIFDNRGVGQSDAPPPPYSVADMAADTIDLMDHLDIGAAHLSGSSLGGAIALHLAIHFPERVLSLQLHSSWLSTVGYAKYSLGLLRKILVTGGVDFYYEATIPLLFSPAFLGNRYAAMSELVEGFKQHAAPFDGLLGQIEANLTHDLASSASLARVPTLITVGEHDLLLPVAESERLQRAIPDSDLFVFPGGGHLVSIEEPASFNRVTLDWLNSNVMGVR